VPVVPVVIEQHPPLHACAALQVVEHVCVAELHALPLGQSALVLQPHVPVGRHTLPAPPIVQSTHAVPVAPHAVPAEPVTHAPPEQQPATQGNPGEHATLQRWVVVLHAPVRQLLFDVPHPQKPPLPAPASMPDATQVVPFGSVAQLAHRPPLSPHADGEVPAWHVPPVLAEQHPPLQGWAELHAVLHVFVVVSQAMPAGQSPGLVHPHAWVPAVVATHALPAALPTQFVQVAEPVLQLAAAVPGSHTLPVPQQPPLHAWLGPQASVQAPPATLHALPVGQSEGPPHPHVPPAVQAVPFGSFAQLMHTPPEGPQWPAPTIWHVSF
jgi:hypothetical protein